MYRDAEQPSKMIQIIADLTLSDKATVREFLGLSDKQPPKRKPKRGHPLDREKALILHSQGLCDMEIANRCGVSKSAVHRWRTENNLPPNRKIRRNGVGG